MKTALILLLLLSQVASSENLILTNNNNEQQTSITGTASIDINTGDVLVETSTDQMFVDRQAALLAFYPATSYLADENEIITVNWGVAFASSCFASVISGNATNWSGSKDSTDGLKVQSNIQVSSLPVTMRLSCNSSAVGLGAAVQNITITEGSVTGSAPTLTMTATPSTSSANPGSPGSYTISYTVQNNAATCTASNGWSGSKPTANGTHPQAINVNNTTTFSLICSNGFGSSPTRSVTVFINSGSPDCVNSPPPAGTTEFLETNGTSWTYKEISGDDFGFSGSASNSYRLPRNTYSAFEAIAPTGTNFHKKEAFETPTTAFIPSGYTVSLSKCPGDFVVADGVGRCKKTNNIFGLNWTTDPNGNPAAECILEPGERYYLNVIHAVPPNFSNTICTNSSGCGVLFTENDSGL